HINNVVNESVLKSSFSSSAQNLSQSTLLTSAYKQEIPDMSFTQDGTSTSLEGAINEAMSQHKDAGLFTALNQVNSYAATDALLEAAYGTSIDQSA
ncbi:MAG: hypothetical protein ACI9TY_001729, partial [Alphaproteobacteria bacterium]